jgi:diguanylate cyclase
MRTDSMPGDYTLFDQGKDETELERVVVLASLSAGYVALAAVSILLLQFENGVAGLWLPNVFAVTVLLRNPAMRLLPAALAIFVAAMAANLMVGADIGLGALYALANTTSVVAGAALIAVVCGDGKSAISGARDYTVMFMLGGVVAPALAAALFSAFAGMVLAWPLLQSFWRWVAGEALGFAVLFPVLMMVSRARLAGLSGAWRLARLAAIVGASTLLALAAVQWTQFPFLPVLVPLMIGAVFLAPFDLAVACGAVGAALVGLAVAGALPGLDLSNGGFAFGFQFAVGVVVALPLLGGLIIEQTRLDRRRIAESEQRFRRAMEDSAIGVVVVALDGRIVEANASFAAMLGYSRAELETLTFFQLTHPDDVAIGHETMQRVRSGELNSYHFEKRYLHKNGTPVWARLSGSVIRDSETGAPLHLVSQIEDIGARKQAEARIAEAETRWNFALASAGQGVWDMDIRKGGTTYSATWVQMLGYEQHELDGDPDRWLTMIHPDDQQVVAEADRAHLEGKTPFFEAEFRMRHKDGHWIWILDRGKALERDENGQLIRAIGSLTDITKRKETEERLAVSVAMLADEKERLRVTLNSIGDAVICTDAATRITFMNPAAEKLTGASSQEAMGVALDEVYAPIDEESGEKIASASVLGGLRQRVEHNNRAVLSRKDGSRCSIREVVSPILTDKGEFSGSVIVFQDFTDARTLQRQLAHAAAHDSLTGLANRASLLNTMAELIGAAPEGDAGHLFLYVDLDNFKTVNDTGGHAAGDLVLKRVAETIRASVRPGDVVARLGGDEFAVILRNCAPAAGEDLARTISAAIGNLGFDHDGKTHKIGASIGMTAIGSGSAVVDDIIARADGACYEAKASGRGTVAVFDSSDRAGSGIARAS